MWIAPHHGEGLRETDENGEHQFVLLERVQTRRATKTDKTYRWYDELRLPPEFGGGLIQERIDITREDRERGFNRTEYTRAIGPSDPDFHRRYGRRNNSEQENAWLKDALYKKRARSVGWRRQKAEMLGWALLINALALEEHRKRRLDEAA